MTAGKPPLIPPFDETLARLKVQAAEDAWNTRDPQLVAAAYTPDCQWRNRSEFITGTDKILDFLTRKWQREHGYALRKSLWAWTADRIAVRFQYGATTQVLGGVVMAMRLGIWANGLMSSRQASINDVAIDAADRRVTGASTAAERDSLIPLK